MNVAKERHQKAFYFRPTLKSGAKVLGGDGRTEDNNLAEHLRALYWPNSSRQEEGGPGRCFHLPRVLSKVLCPHPPPLLLHSSFLLPSGQIDPRSRFFSRKKINSFLIKESCFSCNFLFKKKIKCWPCFGFDAVGSDAPWVKFSPANCSLHRCLLLSHPIH